MPPAASSLMLDEWYEAGDERFVDEVLASRNPGKLKSLAAKWATDARPFARNALLAYVDRGLATPEHRALVKALFKAAEGAKDDEAMAHFLVATDRLAPRHVVTQTRYDWQTRQVTTTQTLAEDPSIPTRAPKKRGAKKKDGRIEYGSLSAFSRVTRHYLQRRAWRYFRKLGHQDVKRYGTAIRRELALYSDEHLTKPENLLDAWGLMHALYWGASAGVQYEPKAPPVLVRKPRGITVADGFTLKSLVPAPFCPEAWKGQEDATLELMLTSHSRTVRAWVRLLLERDAKAFLDKLPMSRVRQLVTSSHDDVQAFGAARLKTVTGVESLPISDWLELLAIDNPEVVPLVCEAVEKHVHPDRLSLAQCLELALSKAASVAALGLAWAKKKPVRDAKDLDALATVAKASAPQVRSEGVEWLCQLLLINEKESKPEHVRALLDSPHADVRAKALELMKKDQRFGESDVLWLAMSESPWPEVRERLVLDLSAREKLFAPEALESVWAAALLAVHKGSRAKRTVAAQLAHRVVSYPKEAERLLPLLAHLLRSVRPPERRTALAALARASFEAPALAEHVKRFVPELTFISEVAS